LGGQIVAGVQLTVTFAVDVHTDLVAIAGLDVSRFQPELEALLWKGHPINAGMYLLGDQ
jgi:hypothetical protein